MFIYFVKKREVLFWGRWEDGNSEIRWKLKSQGKVNENVQVWRIDAEKYVNWR